MCFSTVPFLIFYLMLPIGLINILLQTVQGTAV